MSLQLLDDEVEMALPHWAVAPKGKGVSNHLRNQLLAELANQKIHVDWWRPVKSKTWTSLVNALVENEPAIAERLIRETIDQHRRKYSKQYPLD